MITFRADLNMLGEYVLVRSYSGGVLIGTLQNENMQERWVVLENSRRIHEWYGATDVSELAILGPGEPDKCKICMTVPIRRIYEVCEIIPVPDEVKAIYDSIPDYKYPR